MRNSNGVIIYEGESLFNREPIVALVTGILTPSSNRKTGDMLQSFIIPANYKPTEAINLKKDSSVCGSCPLRKNICYVNAVTLNNIWRAYKTGKYNYVTEELYDYIKTNKFKLRLTAYGEAPAIPFEYWKRLIDNCSGITGYTHRWRSCDEVWKNYLMASVHSSEERDKAYSKGWRTFRIALENELLDKSEVMCKYSSDKMQCATCLLCNGNMNNNKLSVVDYIHGTNWKKNSFNQLKSI